MQITVKVECQMGWGETRTIDVMTLKRRAAGLTIAEIGLTLAEGKALLRAVQNEFVKGQIAEYSTMRGICHHCRNPRRRKDSRSRKLQTVFGAVTVTGGRFRICECEHWISSVFSPISEMLTVRFTPELAARMPFRRAAEILDQFLPQNSQTSHETIRRRTLNVARQIEKIQSQSTVPREDEALKVAYIGLDGAHVRGRPGPNRRNHESLWAGSSPTTRQAAYSRRSGLRISLQQMAFASR